MNGDAPSFVPDSNCIVAALFETHPHHARAANAVNDLLGRGYTMLIVGHTLFEAYSPLTRSPPPHSARPELVVEALIRSFVQRGTVVALEPSEYVAALRSFVDDDVLGGQVYDASIVACARARGAEILLTFNERHFRRFEGDGLTVVVP